MTYTVKMMRRIFYALKQLRCHGQALKAYRLNPLLQIKTVLDIEPMALKAEGYTVLVLDFDGVLASYGEEKPYEFLYPWVNTCVQTFGAGKVFVLSNKPTPIRQQFFATHFPDICFTVGKRKKPYPDGLLQILDLTKVPAHQMLVVDDRLLTGILAAILVGAGGRYVTAPYINLSKRPLSELGFMLLRGMERLLLR